jgi:hypothetical protein
MGGETAKKQQVQLGKQAQVGGPAAVVPISLPLINYRAVLRRTNAAGVWLVSDPAHANDTIIVKLDKNEAVRLLDIGVGEAFNESADSKHKWWKVQVFLGAHLDQAGWVAEAMLTKNPVVKKPGTRVMEAFAAGIIHVDTGQVLTANAGFSGDNVFGCSYEGDDANGMQWLQFAWREVISIDDQGDAAAASGPVTTAVATYQLTEGGTDKTFGTPAKENISVDARSAEDPFQDAVGDDPDDGSFGLPGTGDRSATSAGFFDSPLSAQDVVKAAFDQGDKTVIARFHGQQFLVKDRSTIQFATQVDIEWKYTDPKQLTSGAPKGVQTGTIIGPVGALPKAMADKLLELYPGFVGLTAAAGNVAVPDYSAALMRVMADKVWMVGDPERAADSIIVKLDRGERVILLDPAPDVRFNRNADSQHKWWKVRVFFGASQRDVNGPHYLKEGWIAASMLGTNIKVTKAGTRASATLGAGKVTLITGMGFEAIEQMGVSEPSAFSLSYEGKDADRMQWLQFASREIIGVDDAGNATPKTGPVTTDIATYQLTEGGTKDVFGTPGKDNFSVDSRSRSDPFQDAKDDQSMPGSAERTAEATTYFDPPGPIAEGVKEIFDGGATIVLERFHGFQFLVKERTAVQYAARVDVEWKYDDPKQALKDAAGLYSNTPQPVAKGTLIGPASSLSQDLADKLHELFPGFANLK